MTEEQKNGTRAALQDLIMSKMGMPSGSFDMDMDDDDDPRLNKPQMKSQSGGQGKNKNKQNKQNNNQDQDGSGSGKQQERDPQIGDRGDPDIQAAEELERQANKYEDESQASAETSKKAGKSDLEKKNKDLAGKAGDVADEAKKAADDAALGEADRARIERIKKNLADVELQRKIIDETQRQVFTERELEADRKLRKEYMRNPRQQFLDSIERFIRREVADQRGPTWRRPDKRFAPETNIIHKGRAIRHDIPIPLLAVYFDRSSSWDESKIKVGQEAISNLNRFVRQNRLKIKIYYFGDRVSSDPEDVGGCTSATQKILDHIEQIKADNVLIMTDSDMDGQGAFTRPVTVKGGVWFLFKGGRCDRITHYLHGKKLTKEFNLN